jgi:transketolase
MEISELEEKAKELRRRVLKLAFERHEGHIGGGLGVSDILVALFEDVLKDKDKFVLSCGQNCLPYFLLLRDKGYNPNISGHPSMDVENGIPCTTGSLGHGMPMAMGMAFAKKKAGEEGRVYVLMGDGECQEGSIWESMMLASQHNLDNFVVIVNRNNRQQSGGDTDEILPMGNLDEKFKAFGAHVLKADGHDFESLIETFKEKGDGKPIVIIAKTVKGKGVSYMEEGGWHTRIPDEEKLKQALEELE